MKFTLTILVLVFILIQTVKHFEGPFKNGDVFLSTAVSKFHHEDGYRLGCLFVPEQEIIPFIRECLDSKSPAKLIDAFSLLPNVKSNIGEFVPYVSEHLTNENSWVRFYAILALWKIGPPEQENYLSALIEMLSVEDKARKMVSLHLLSDFGPNARSALPSIEKLLESEEQDLVYFAKATIKKISN